MTTKRPTLVKLLVFILTALGLEAFSVGCGIAGALIGVRILGDGSMLDLGLAIIGVFLGGLIGIVAGIIAIKYLFHEKGSVLLAFSGAAVWTGVSILMALTLDTGNSIISNIVTVSFLVIPVAAVGGFYIKR